MSNTNDAIKQKLESRLIILLYAQMVLDQANGSRSILAAKDFLWSFYLYGFNKRHELGTGKALHQVKTI